MPNFKPHYSSPQNSSALIYDYFSSLIQKTIGCFSGSIQNLLLLYAITYCIYILSKSNPNCSSNGYFFLMFMRTYTLRLVHLLLCWYLIVLSTSLLFLSPNSPILSTFFKRERKNKFGTCGFVFCLQFIMWLKNL